MADLRSKRVGWVPVAPHVAAVAVAVAVGGAVALAGCGARSNLDSLGDDGVGASEGAAAAAGGAGAGGLTGGTGGGAGGAAGGAGGQGGQCAAVGEGCAVDPDCCDGLCTSGTCGSPLAPCAGDTAPVLLAEGLHDPYSMDGDATSLFVGQLGGDGLPLLRIPKAGGPAEVLVESVSFLDFVLVKEETIFFSDQFGVSSVPTQGGAKTTLTTAPNPSGLDVTPTHVYFANYLSEQPFRIDRTTLETEVLAKGLFPGIYRVAASEATSLVYFSSFDEGLWRYHIGDGQFEAIPDTAPARSVQMVSDVLHFTDPTPPQIKRLGAQGPELVADLTPLGTFVESLKSDPQFLYVTLDTGVGAATDPGIIVRIPLSGGAPEIIADAQGPRPTALVVDEACVYWTERATGTLYRARKDPSP